MYKTIFGDICSKVNFSSNSPFKTCPKEIAINDKAAYYITFNKTYIFYNLYKCAIKYILFI